MTKVSFDPAHDAYAVSENGQLLGWVRAHRSRKRNGKLKLWWWVAFRADGSVNGIPLLNRGGHNIYRRRADGVNELLAIAF